MLYQHELLFVIRIWDAFEAVWNSWYTLKFWLPPIPLNVFEFHHAELAFVSTTVAMKLRSKVEMEW